LTYFFDNCLSYKFANMLKALDVDAIALRERYAENISDVDLFTALRGSGVVFITADASQTTRIQEATALREAGITALFLGKFWSKMTFWNQAIWTIRKWDRIEGFAANVTTGICAEIKQNGAARPFAL